MIYHLLLLHVAIRQLETYCHLFRSTPARLACYRTLVGVGGGHVAIKVHHHRKSEHNLRRKFDLAIGTRTLQNLCEYHQKAVKIRLL
jgi:hypothetical protein